MHWLLILPCLALFSCGRYGAFLLRAFLLRAFLLRAVRVAGGTCCGRYVLRALRCCGVAGNSVCSGQGKEKPNLPRGPLLA
jgi:hypothetical protein